jgi:hypothetical protein
MNLVSDRRFPRSKIINTQDENARPGASWHMKGKGEKGTGSDSGTGVSQALGDQDSCYRGAVARP